MAEDETMKRMRQEFSTMDIYLAAFLSLKDVDTHPVMNDRGKVMFVFDKEETYKHMPEYNNPGTMISIVDFVREIKFLRGIMNQMRIKS